MNPHPNNRYTILEIPIDYHKSFLSLGISEIQEYFRWFINTKNNRLTLLCNFLFKYSEDCLHEKNLDVVEIFFQNAVTAIPKSEEQIKTEFEKVPKHLRPYAKPDNYFLDNQTISVCYDIGIFLGELLIKLDDKIIWQLETNDAFADYEQPILAKKGIRLRLNPFKVAKNIAANIYESKYQENELMKVFNTWKKLYKSG